MAEEKIQIVNLLVGNPGLGKSTICTSLTGKAFKSGLSKGKGLTTIFDHKPVESGPMKGEIVGDSPGLDDPKTREAAALEISKALKLQAYYKIFFLVRLQNGRMVPSDLDTVKAVMGSLPQNTPYYVIFNQIATDQEMEWIHEGEYLTYFHTEPTRLHAIKMIPSILGGANAVLPAEHLHELSNFMQACPPSNKIEVEHVRDIETREALWKKMTEEHERKIEELKQQSAQEKAAAVKEANKKQKEKYSQALDQATKLGWNVLAIIGQEIGKFLGMKNRPRDVKLKLDDDDE